MTKEFLPYTESLQLKEIGFEEHCIASYFFPQLQSLKYTRTWQRNSTLLMGKDGCTAPLYQQAFRWFREKYKLHQFIQSDFSYNISGGIWDVNGYKDCRYDIDSEPFYSYEEAELACLRNLIEIVKSKTTQP